jgi:hypothetical protein
MLTIVDISSITQIGFPKHLSLDYVTVKPFGRSPFSFIVGSARRNILGLWTNDATHTKR